jgi:hypothetical protein
MTSLDRSFTRRPLPMYKMKPAAFSLATCIVLRLRCFSICLFSTGVRNQQTLTSPVVLILQSLPSASRSLVGMSEAEGDILSPLPRTLVAACSGTNYGRRQPVQIITFIPFTLTCKFFLMCLVWCLVSTKGEYNSDFELRLLLIYRTYAGESIRRAHADLVWITTAWIPGYAATLGYILLTISG